MTVLRVIAEGLSRYEGCASWIEYTATNYNGVGFFRELGDEIHVMRELHCVLRVKDGYLVMYENTNKVFSVELCDPDSISKIASFLGVDESKDKTIPMTDIDIIAKLCEVDPH